MTLLGTIRFKLNARTLRCMLRIYCHQHHTGSKDCPECLRILEYSLQRHQHCRFGAWKPICSQCESHCFKKDMAQKVSEIMCYSGPRMSYRHPLLTLYHLAERFIFSPARIGQVRGTRASTGKA